jgi:hypothetical protein
MLHAGVMQFNRRLLSQQATDVWANPAKVQEYYLASLRAADSSLTDQSAERLPRLNDEQTREYQKWTPFADVWDVCCVSFLHLCFLHYPCMQAFPNKT